MFKAQQVLRTAVAITAAEGVEVPALARVVVMEAKQDGTARVKVADATLPALSKVQFVASVGDLTATRRGRPRKGA